MISRWRSSGAPVAAAFAKAKVVGGGGVLSGSNPRFLTIHWRLAFMFASRAPSAACCPTGEPQPVHGSQPGLARVGAVVARGDVAERALADDRAVEQRVEEADRLAELLVHQRDQAGPQRRDRAGAADDERPGRRRGPGSRWSGRRRRRRRARRGPACGLPADDRAPRRWSGTPAARRSRSRRRRSRCSWRPRSRPLSLLIVVPRCRAAWCRRSRARTGWTPGSRRAPCRRPTPSAEPLSPDAHADRDAQAAAAWKAWSNCVIACAVQFDLGRAPADRDDRRLVDVVVDGGRDRVEEALVGVGREVDGDRRLGRDRRRDLDVEHHLAVGAVGVGRMVAAAVDADRLDVGSRQPEAAEIGADVGRLEAAAELDDGDALAAAVDTGREVVERRRAAAA